MVKMVWFLKQPFSGYGRFKMRARHVLGLAHRVDTVTKLGRSASPRWSRVHALLRVVGHGCLWPGRHWPLPRGAAAAACVAVRRCWLSRRVADPPYAAT